MSGGHFRRRGADEIVSIHVERHGTQHAAICKSRLAFGVLGRAGGMEET